MAVKYVRHDADGSGDGTTTANSGANGAWTFAQMLAATPAAGDEIRILDTGTYTRSATGTIAYANGTAAANIVITGANASGTVDGTRPTIQASAGSITLLSLTTSHVRLQDVIVDGNSQTTVTGVAFSQSYLRARNVKVQGTTVYAMRSGTSNSTHFDRCEATGCSGSGAFFLEVANAQAFACYAHDNTCHGFVMGPGACAAFCVADTNTGGSTDGFNCGSVGYKAYSCTAYANGRDGFNLDSNAGFGSLLANCLAYGNGGEGFGSDGVKSGAFLVNCAGGSNTSGNYNASNLPNVEGFVALTGDPFTNAAGGDFSLNNTAGAGAACRAAGFPGAALFGTGYLDIGAVQHQDSGGGGGGVSGARIFTGF